MNKSKSIEEERAEKQALRAENELLKAKLEEAQKMLDKKEGYKQMKNQIDEQKTVTRQALSLIADVSRSEINDSISRTSQYSFE